MGAIYGNTSSTVYSPVLDIDDDQSDLIGIRTLKLSQFWMAPSPWNIADYDALKPPVPGVNGGLILVGNQTVRDGGGFRTHWHFEGVDGDGKSVTFKQRGNTLDYGFTPGFSTVDALLFPNIQSLATTYGGTFNADGSITWAPQYTPQASGSLGFPAAGDQGSTAQSNPLFGFKDWLRVEGTYHCRYAGFTIQGLFNGAGLIAETGDLPGQPPVDLAKGGNWLYLPTYVRRGPVFDITENYWLNPTGWPEEIYGEGAQTPDS